MAAPTKLTKEVIVQLRTAASKGCSVPEMALIVGIAKQTLYNWLEADQELMDELDTLRETPVLKARETVIAKLDESFGNSMDYLKRRKKDEFGDRTEVDLNTPKPLLVKILGKDESNDDNTS